jgi:hypothetical protein
MGVGEWDARLVFGAPIGQWEGPIGQLEAPVQRMGDIGEPEGPDLGSPPILITMVRQKTSQRNPPHIRKINRPDFGSIT